MENVLEIDGLIKKYDGFELKNVSFQLPKGSIMGFIGQNGAGKTTTIYSILDIIKPESGRISVFGLDHVKDQRRIKERIGVVFDEMGYHNNMTPRQLNRMMKQVYQEWQQEAFFQYMERFALPLHKKCGSFSRGMRMKLQIAVALSHQAELLIMDEPTSGLDPIVRNEILDIFQEYVEQENHTILLSSHIIGDLERIADEITFIDRGRILLSDNKDAILENHGMIKCRKQDVKLLRQEDIVGIKKSTYGAQVLVRNPKECMRKYPELMMEPASLEEIMLYYVAGKTEIA